jgi:hypothetical protein
MVSLSASLLDALKLLWDAISRGGITPEEARKIQAEIMLNIRYLDDYISREQAEDLDIIRDGGD